MSARLLAHLDDAERVYRFGLGVEPVPEHVVPELARRFWFWRRRGYWLPHRVLVIHGGRP